MILSRDMSIVSILSIVSIVSILSIVSIVSILSILSIVNTPQGHFSALGLFVDSPTYKFSK